MHEREALGRVQFLTPDSAVPGLDTPDAELESPFEMLQACHERVDRMLTLLAKLQRHLAHTGCDDAARRAAGDLLRYFDVAAPLHHQDEELHVFPALMALPDPALHTLVLGLLQDHRAMEAAWPAARQVLCKLSDGPSTPARPAPLPAGDCAQLAAFAGLYQSHMQAEENQVYPAAQQAISHALLLAMSADMMQRRGVPPQR
jgi:hemerythrin-like domain-containing protein